MVVPAMVCRHGPFGQPRLLPAGQEEIHADVTCSPLLGCSAYQPDEASFGRCIGGLPTRTMVPGIRSNHDDRTPAASKERRGHRTEAVKGSRQICAYHLGPISLTLSKKEMTPSNSGIADKH